MSDEKPICGFETNDGTDCQRIVPQEGIRCPKHPKTVLEEPFDPENYDAPTHE